MDRIDYEYLVRNIVEYKAIGKTNVGWKMEIVFHGQYSYPSLDKIGTWSKAGDPGRFHLYFRDEETMNSLISVLEPNHSLCEN